MVECRYCRTKYDESKEKCPNCGSTMILSEDDLLKEETQRKKEEENQKRHNTIFGIDKRKIKIAGLAVVLMIVIFIVVSLITAHNEMKEIYSIGLSYYENNEVEEAIEQLNQIPPSSGYYDDAQQIIGDATADYVKSVLLQTKTLVDDSDYVSAMETIDYAISLLPENTELTSERNVIAEKFKSYAIKKSAAYVKEDKYSKAINVLNSALDCFDDDELQTNLTSYKNTYRNQVTKKANNQLNKKGFQSAMNTLKNAQKVLGDDKQLQETIDKIETYRPVELSNMEPYEMENACFSDEYSDLEYSKDNYGNAYDPERVIFPCYYDDPGVVRYLINKQYTILEGKIFVPYEARNIRKSDIEEDGRQTTIKIYGDGKLLYTAKNIHGTAKPYNFVVNINGVEFLEIRLKGQCYDSHWSRYPTMCIANLAVSKR